MHLYNKSGYLEGKYFMFTKVIIILVFFIPSWNLRYHISSLGRIFLRIYCRVGLLTTNSLVFFFLKMFFALILKGYLNWISDFGLTFKLFSMHVINPLSSRFQFQMRNQWLSESFSPYMKSVILSWLLSRFSLHLWLSAALIYCV